MQPVPFQSPVSDLYINGVVHTYLSTLRLFEMNPFPMKLLLLLLFFPPLDAIIHIPVIIHNSHNNQSKYLLSSNFHAARACFKWMCYVYEKKNFICNLYHENLISYYVCVCSFSYMKKKIIFLFSFVDPLELQCHVI